MNFRRVWIVLSILTAIVIVSGAAGYLWLRTSLPQTSGRIALDGLDAPVTIVRDENAVPHIFASNQRDAYFALGFTHAQDRLWQMEFLRRLASGRLAEVLGEKAVGTDKYLRTLGLAPVADAMFERVSPEVRAILVAYAAGVNA